jgi:hypothetical protein
MSQAALHLHLVDGPRADQRREFFALHCEPREDGLTRASRYKRGPHVHCTYANDPLSHAHIPLCLSNLDTVVGFLSEFDRAFVAAMEMIQMEIIERLGKLS